MGAQVILSPSAWAVDADHDNARDPYGKLWRDSYTELARLYDVTVIGVSNVGPITGGPWAGRKCIGCSLAVGPGGEVLAEGPYGERGRGGGVRGRAAPPAGRPRDRLRRGAGGPGLPRAVGRVGAARASPAVSTAGGEQGKHLGVRRRSPPYSDDQEKAMTGGPEVPSVSTS